MSLREIPLREASPFAGWQRKLHRILFLLFVLQWALVEGRFWLELPRWTGGGWPDGLLLVLATATTLAALADRLPGQNVMAAALSVAIIGSAAACLAALTAIPFGPLTYTRNFGHQLFYPLPWAVPMLWIVAVLNSRDVARWLLRPWRHTWNYGWWLIGLTVVLTVMLDLALEPYATVVKQYWSWKPTRLASDWYSTPWVNFLGWAVTSLLILAFVTPWLLHKQPTKQPPPDYFPLAIWLLLNLLFLSAAVRHHLWPAVWVTGLQLLAVTAACAAIRLPKTP